MAVNKGLSEGAFRIARSVGCHDCGGKCPLLAHVRDGRISRIEGDDAEEPHQLRACLRGRAYRQLVYHPERLKSPMKRTGARGEGKFESISWDEALGAVARGLKRIKETYGNSAILLVNYTGSPGALHNGEAVARLLSMFGGYTATWGLASSEAAIVATRLQYGSFRTGNSRDDLVNSRLIIMWGWNPAETIWGTNTFLHLIRAKEAGSRIIAVDPRFHDSAAAIADQWIPIRPGTDPAMMAAMAHVMLASNLYDQRFIDTYTIGFSRYREYVLGTEDGVPKTPEWAEQITGVPARTIENLAREYAGSKPAALIDGLGIGRSAAGEQSHRAAMTLSAMTGNIGIHGGWASGGLQRIPVGEHFLLPHIPVPKNPVEAGVPSVRGSINPALRSRTRVHISRLWDAILKGKAGGYPSDIKSLYVVCGNPLNQFPNANKGAAALQSLDFMVVHDLFMTATARFADILLPVTTPEERNDVYRPWVSGPYYLFDNKAVEPLHKCKSDFEIARELAPRLGIARYSDKTEAEWLREFITGDESTAGEIQDYDKFRREGVHRVRLEEPIVAFKKEIEDPANNPFSTASGKIEIYSQAMAELNNPACPPVPKYVEAWEGPSDALVKRYPLQLISPHFKRRAHSIFDNIPWLRELERHSVLINSADAQSRGIKDGDQVKVFNDRGTIAIPARVTERIMPGVVSIGQGAWFSPDKAGVDRGGCANTLMRDEYSPVGALACNTCLVEVKRA